jgi:uncharacterized lipoprotein NlpE involved in copper resistance
MINDDMYLKSKEGIEVKTLNSNNEYEIVNMALGGTWKKDSANVKFISGGNGKVNIEILTGKPFKFNLSYTVNDETVTKQINVESF